MGNSNIVQGELVVGRISTVHGVRGWVKIKSFTELAETVFDYQPWLIEKDGITHKVEIDAWKRQGDGLIAHLQGVDDRDDARDWCHKDISVAKATIPKLEEKEFYWYQLEGLSVYSCHDQQEQRLGLVTSLLETGANDVLVVKGDSDSIDKRERLIPYTQNYVLNVDLDSMRIDVDWDPDF